MQMDLESLSKLLCTQARTEAIKAALSDRKCRRTMLCGLIGSSAAMVISRMPVGNRRVLVVCNDADEAGYMYNDLCQFSDDQTVLIFPSGYKRDIKYGQIDAPSVILRTEVLAQWEASRKLRFIVTYPEALAERVACRQTISQATIVINEGSQFDMTDMARQLRQNGFAEVDYVYEPGQFAIRGSILDIYSYANELPYRIDFFGDDVESIRTFNVETQLSEQRVKSVSIVNSLGSDTKSDSVSLIDYIDDNTIIVAHNLAGIVARVEAVTRETISESTLIANEGDKDALANLIDFSAFSQRIAQFRVVEYSAATDADNPGALIRFPFSAQGIYHKNFDLISKSFTELLAGGYRLFILTESEKQTQRLHDIFADRGDEIPFTPILRTIHEGFVDNEAKVCVFTDHQIFDRFHKYSLKSERARSGKLALSIKELNSIEVGDYIVHVDHGIGRFGGLVRTNVNGTPQEMIKLVYMNDDIIFVSIHSLHKLAKYRGKEGMEPRLNKLGSGAWNRIKDKTKSKLKDIARDLIKLYAARKQKDGFAFSPDGYLQHELEASFIYEDTPDQLKATTDVKADMESRRPMDRLICGDVGFGKTEVAIRAAFKAATDGKQTAVLVPTTVLAYQHFNTFTDRLKEFPVKVDYISRARKPKDIKRIVSELADGKIDIIIGTHKLISKDIKFKDLGLLVVDEEQKFGVAVKEKLKQLKVNVDTLTLSATPIPRTLQFSLMGARDLTTITTPPPNRYPILTTVSSLNDEIVTEAINFELSRNGQVFFINNRIEELYNLEAMVHRLIPDARVVVGHGQMPSEKLEQIILGFANHEFDILLATTIVESGIDMPNVNTIIINNAQNFGLSELHQLRGRVGRSSRKAFCYLLVPPYVPLSPISRRRLQAIESFSDLGSGIQIAMQDLDIRGAGNLLGAEQSGFIADLGYETYQKILKEAVIELRTEEFSDTFDDATRSDDETTYTADCVIESDMELMFPYDYVPQENERISLYQELDNMEREADVEAFERRLEDRFGKIPPMAMELIRIVTLRRIARTLGIEKIALKQKRMYMYFVGQENQAYYQSAAFGRILSFLQKYPTRCDLRQKNDRRSIVVNNVGTVKEAADLLNEITSLASL